jgi:molybdate transport system ATP-binding protein
MAHETSPAVPREARLLVEMEGVTVRLRDQHILPQTCWQVREGEQWAVLGPNGSGKSSLVRSLAGLAPTSSGVIRWHLDGGRAGVGYVAFELEEELLGREAAREEARSFAHDFDGALTARALLAAAGPPGAFDLEPLLDRPLRALSAGELRRVLIARALAGRPRLLVLDEPFDGLDGGARLRLKELLSGLARSGIPLILVTHHREELPQGITHLLLLRSCRIVAQGPRAEVLAGHRLEELYGPDAAEGATMAPDGPPASLPERAAAGAPLVELREVTVRYGETTVLDRVSWTLRRGERWALLGPNGSGKSTLLELIHGDNPQAYANEVRLFGRRRGSGESLWELREKLGFVSSRLQAAYRPSLPVREVVASGFFDSIGLYRRPGPGQLAAAEGWIGRLGLGELASRPFLRLSYGQRRLVLVARAMVKDPELLILDEPCDGLDPAKRRMVLELIERIGRQTAASLLYVSHREDELPLCLTHRLRLAAGRVAECVAVDRNLYNPADAAYNSG